MSLERSQTGTSAKTKATGNQDRPAVVKTGLVMVNEDQALTLIQGSLAAHFGSPPESDLWIGDDAAAVACPPPPLLLATDAVVVGVHADLSLVEVADVGWKAMAVSLSDLAAMGARPLHSLVTLALPPEIDVRELSEGLAEAASEWSCPVVGGDLTSSSELVVSVAVTGTLWPEDIAPEEPWSAQGRQLTEREPAELDKLARPVTRSGAKPGDTLFVTGPLGASAAGLRLLRHGEREGAAVSDTDRALVRSHRRPRARLVEGWTARMAGATAMIDVSDGLGRDIDRMASASAVGLSLTSVPAAAGATTTEALEGGEDYELIVATSDPDRLVEAFSTAGLRPPVSLGVCCSDAQKRLLEGKTFSASGYRHSFGARA